MSLDETPELLQVRQRFAVEGFDADAQAPRPSADGKWTEFGLHCRSILSATLAPPNWAVSRVSQTHGFGAYRDPVESIGTMRAELELSVILTTYERPRHLERSLASLAVQKGMAGRFEVVVVDDGSKDRTHDVVHRFARTVDFSGQANDARTPRLPRRTLPKRRRTGELRILSADFGQRLSVSAAPSEYGTCVPAGRGLSRAGNCFRLDRETTQWLTVAMSSPGVSTPDLVRRTVADLAAVDQRRALPDWWPSDQAEADGIQHRDFAERFGNSQWL